MNTAELSAATGVADRQLQRMRTSGLLEYERSSRGRGMGRTPAMHPPRAVAQVESVMNLLALYQNWDFVFVARWLQGHKPESGSQRARFLGNVRDALQTGLERFAGQRNTITESQVLSKVSAEEFRTRYKSPVLGALRKTLGKNAMSDVLLNAARLFELIEGQVDNDSPAHAVNAVSPLENIEIPAATIPAIAMIFHPESLHSALLSASDDDLEHARVLTVTLHDQLMESDIWRDAGIPKHRILSELAVTVTAFLVAVNYARR